MAIYGANQTTRNIMNQELIFPGFMAFNYVAAGGTDEEKVYDIQTPYMDLEASRSVVNIGMTHIVDPSGNSASWSVEILNKEVVGDSDDPKSLRVHYKISTGGPHSNISVADVQISGLLFSGTAGSEVLFN